MYKTSALLITITLASCNAPSDDASETNSFPAGPISTPTFGGALDDITPTYVTPDERAVEIVSDYVMREKGDAIRFEIDREGAAQIAFPMLAEAADRCMHLYNFLPPKNPQDKTAFPQWIAAKLKLAGGRYIHNGMNTAVYRAQDINGYESQVRSTPGKIKNYREAADLGMVNDSINAARGIIESELKDLIKECQYIADQYPDVFMSTPPKLPVEPGQMLPMHSVEPIHEQEYLYDFAAQKLIGHRYTSD